MKRFKHFFGNGFFGTAKDGPWVQHEEAEKEIALREAQVKTLTDALFRAWGERDRANRQADRLRARFREANEFLDQCGVPKGPMVERVKALQ